MRKNTTISKCAGGVNAPRLLATRTYETTKIPAGMQKPDVRTFRYAPEQKNQKMTKTIKGNYIFSNLCFTYSNSFQSLPVATYRYISMHGRLLSARLISKVENFRLFSKINTKQAWKMSFFYDMQIINGTKINDCEGV